ncbi:competence type IV pilus minor pilin ComGG [Neobacillus niacini]|uniref:competence type IV pilus minor pilin ComGG n=1 Tax=Neobacillus niacini TaxID=86668 RepID=UPI002858C3B6|nr:competence type IV pilus minor pilin ComGG [Neobacillus niacini]MDR6998726.1 competence protein ComGG [Neobacillus niacini]
MKKNQAGFTYPLTLCVVLVFFLFLSIRVEQLLTERKVVNQTAILLQEEYYFLSSIKKVENRLTSTGTIQSKGSFKYGNGTMDYQADAPVNSVQRVNFTLRLSSGITVIGIGYFDTKLKRIVKWAEKN